jgi:hypothetical protein
VRSDLLEEANLAALLDHLPKASILARYANARGDELRHKFLSPESSSALVANAFGFFLERPGALTLPCPPLACGEAVSVLLEEEMRFPWSGGTHPWLDVVVETKSAVIGIESKRYEPYRDKKQIKFSDAYSRAIWGDQMFPFETMRDELLSQRQSFQFVGAAQLVKHAFGLRTQAHKRGKRAVLCYLFAQPRAYPDGNLISIADHDSHVAEIDKFTIGVAGAEVTFCSLPYRTLLSHWLSFGELDDHANAVLRRFGV